MAQRMCITKPAQNLLFTIDDNELCLFEFQDFFEKVKSEVNIPIDGYSGALIRLEKNRILAQLITNKIYEIEDNFPESKQSISNPKKQISKKVAIRFFESILEVLEIAYSNNCDISISGE